MRRVARPAGAGARRPDHGRCARHHREQPLGSAGGAGFTGRVAAALGDAQRHARADRAGVPAHQAVHGRRVARVAGADDPDLHGRSALAPPRPEPRGPRGQHAEDPARVAADDGADRRSAVAGQGRRGQGAGRPGADRCGAAPARRRRAGGRHGCGEEDQRDPATRGGGVADQRERGTTAAATADPDRQRAQVHAPGGPSGHPGQREPGERDDLRRRFGPRDRARRPAARLRALLAGRQGAVEGRWRHRARPDHREADRGVAWRPPRRTERGRPRLHPYDPAAGGDTARGGEAGRRTSRLCDGRSYETERSSFAACVGDGIVDGRRVRE